MVAGHIWTDKSDPQDPSLFKWWKVCSYLWTMVYWWNWIISVVFWSFLLPTTDFADDFDGTPWGEANLLCDHILPLFFCMVDWFLNGIVFEKHHLATQLPIIFVYGMWNLIFCKITNSIIYPGMTWDSFSSVILALGCLPLAALFWMLIYWCT